MDFMRYRNAVLLLILVHAVLALHAAWNLSPVWDEIVYPAAGYDLLSTGRIRASLDHPPLGKALLALPLFLQGTSLRTAPTDADALNSFQYGFYFVHQNARPARWMIFLPRLMNVFLSCLLALLISVSARAVWNEEVGILALALYAFLPPVLARASLALLEMPLALFMMVSLLSAARWRNRREPWCLAAWTLGWTAALLTKVNAVVLLPIFLLADAVPRERDKVGLFRRWTETTLVAGISLGLCEMVLRGFGQSYWMNQLMARKNDLTTSRFPIYFHGATWSSAFFFMAPCAWLLKTPLPFIILAAAGWALWKRAKPKDEIFIYGSCAFLVTGLQMAGVRSIIATGHYFYLWGLGALMSSAVVTVNSSRLQWGVKALAGSILVSSLWVHPQYLAYFNILVGGSAHGYRWLSDSDQDWGQGLPSLSHWMKQENLTQILLGYSGAGDPRVYGITYQDVISPALITASYRGEVFPRWSGRVVLALGTKVAQTEGDLLGWLLSHRTPIGQVGYTFLIYDFTQDREAQEWLAWLYRFSRRPRLAAALPLSHSSAGVDTP